MSERWFWLDGGGSQHWSGSRSIIGRLTEDDLSLTFDASRREVVAHPSQAVIGDDIFEVLAELLDGDPDTHWVGCFGYAARPDLPGRPAPGLPDAVWMRTRDVRVVTEPAAVEQPGSTHTDVATVPDWYADAFAQVIEAVSQGQVDEMNLTFRVPLAEAPHADPLDLYRRLRTTNPAPYAGLLRHGDTWLLSASPERFVTIDRHRTIQTRPIKGTTPRGADPAADADQRRRLLTEPKFHGEHLTTVAMTWTELDQICEPGTVKVADSMSVETYRSVHQLVSTVTGRLRHDVDTLGALRSMFPPGSMTGVPKPAAMELIDAIETTPRGLYSGAFGWISGDGRADLGVVIRSMVKHGDGPWWVGTGGGLTAASRVEEEWAEAAWKIERLRAVLADASAPSPGQSSSAGRA